MPSSFYHQMTFSCIRLLDFNFNLALYEVEKKMLNQVSIKKEILVTEAWVFDCCFHQIHHLNKILFFQLDYSFWFFLLQIFLDHWRLSWLEYSICSCFHLWLPCLDLLLREELDESELSIWIEWWMLLLNFKSLFLHW